MHRASDPCPMELGIALNPLPVRLFHPHFSHLAGNFSVHRAARFRPGVKQRAGAAKTTVPFIPRLWLPGQNLSSAAN